MATATESSTEAGANAANGSAKTTGDKGSKDYYGYLFEDNKTPTKTLDALLRAIAQHIVRSALF